MSKIDYLSSDDKAREPETERRLQGTVERVTFNMGDITLHYADGRQVLLRAVGWDAEYIDVGEEITE
jgi:hypothetical protein